MKCNYSLAVDCKEKVTNYLIIKDNGYKTIIEFYNVCSTHYEYLMKLYLFKGPSMDFSHLLIKDVSLSQYAMFKLLQE